MIDYNIISQGCLAVDSAADAKRITTWRLKMKVIGLTGGIGSGKSTAAQFLKALGAVVIDLDGLGHDVLKKSGEVYKQLLSAFGEDILASSGEIDRARLGKIVFNSPEALKRLNKIVHPVIDKKVEEEIEKNRCKGVKAVFLEAAAILEAEKTWQVDELWVITTPEADIIRRIKDRPDYNEMIAKSRIRAQMPNSERIKKADVVITNDGTIEQLKNKVEVEWNKLQKRL